jgi:xylulokinase
MKYIGIDLGTSGVKILLITSEGAIIKSVSRSYELLVPHPMWTEQNPDDWFNQTLSGLKEIVIGNENEIKAISFSGQMHGLVVLDKDDTVIRNAMLWNDQRTIEEVKYLNDVIGIDILLKETGNIALTGLTAPKLLWMKNNEIELFKKIAKIMLPKDYLLYKLSNVFATDVSDVSGTLYYDVENKQYSKRMLEILEISESQLPRVFESSEVVGKIDKKIASILGLNNEVLIIAGGGDQAVGAIGTGVVSAGECSISLGTSGAIFVADNNFFIDNVSYLQSYAHTNGKYHMMGVTLNAAGSLKWWLESILKDKNYDEFFNNIINTPINDSLYFLPYLNGERAPINDPNAKGLFIGLRHDHKREYIGRAVIEGITYSLKQTFDLIKNLGVNMKLVKITGGGARSKVWAQIIADIFNIKIVTIESEEGPAYGAAIIAMVGDKVYKSVEEACLKLIKIKDEYTPNQKNVSEYERKYEVYKKIYPQVKSLYEEL